MCIVCNCPPISNDPDVFLSEYEKSRQAMARATAAMLVVSKVAITPEARARYDRTHKAMVRLQREWNGLERLRERMSDAELLADYQRTNGEPGDPDANVLLDEIKRRNLDI